MSAEIRPIGGKHRSARSLLAEIMNDPRLAKCVVVTFDEDGDTAYGDFAMTRGELCFAAVVIQRRAFEE